MELGKPNAKKIHRKVHGLAPKLGGLPTSHSSEIGPIHITDIITDPFVRVMPVVGEDSHNAGQSPDYTIYRPGRIPGMPKGRVEIEKRPATEDEILVLNQLVTEALLAAREQRHS